MLHDAAAYRVRLVPLSLSGPPDPAAGVILASDRIHLSTKQNTCLPFAKESLEKRARRRTSRRGLSTSAPSRAFKRFGRVSVREIWGARDKSMSKAPIPKAEYLTFVKNSLKLVVCV